MNTRRMFSYLTAWLAAAACVVAIVPSAGGQVPGPVTLAKTFTNDPVRPGDTVTLEFTISNFDPRSVAADIAFADDLDAVLPGLVATGLPASGICGPASVITGTSVLSFSGGSVDPGASCTFSVTLAVPQNASPGEHSNTTSALTTELEGRPLTGQPATDTLTVAGPPVIPTLGEWGLMLMAALLGLVAWRHLRLTNGTLSTPS